MPAFLFCLINCTIHRTGVGSARHIFTANSRSNKSSTILTGNLLATAHLARNKRATLDEDIPLRLRLSSGMLVRSYPHDKQRTERLSAILMLNSLGTSTVCAVIGKPLSTLLFHEIS